MPETCYRTGQIAKALGRSSYQIRQLCEAGLIEAEYSGKQWRIPASEVERLQKEGVPEVPASGKTGEALNGNGATRPASNKAVTNGLLAPPSPAVVSAAEELAITENLLRKRRVELELMEVEDRFHERQEAEAEKWQAEEEAERHSVAQENAARLRQERDTRWIEYALRSIPVGAEGEETKIHGDVRAALARMDVSESDVVVERIVDGIVARILKPWRRQQQANEIASDAIKSLPCGATGFSWNPSAWDIQAKTAALSAILALGDSVTAAEMRTVAIEAVSKVGAEFEFGELRQSILHGVRLPWGLPADRRQLALQAVRDAMGKLPLGTPRSQLEATRDAAVKLIVQRHEHEKCIAKIVTKVGDEMLQEVGTENRKVVERFQQNMTQALGQLPVGTDERTMIEHCDEMMKPFRDAVVESHRQQAAKQRLEADKASAERRLNRVVTASRLYDFLRHMEKEGEGVAFDAGFDRGFSDCWNTAGKVLARIRPILLNEIILQGAKMTDQQIESCAEHLARTHLDEFLDADGARREPSVEAAAKR